MENLHNISQIDWNKMWKSAKQVASWKNREAGYWNEQAREYYKQVRVDNYVERLLSIIKVDAKSTVLDIGCGPGNLVIPLSKRVKCITALDISKEMLNYVRKDADQEGLTNIKYVNKKWEDVVIGEDVEVYDVIIASRSLVWFDLREALSKIDRISKKRVYLTRPVSPSSFDVEVYRTIGKKYNPGPNYIYVYNLLYQMGIYANVQIFESKNRSCYLNLDKALDNWRWRMGKFKPDEEEKLRIYLSNQLQERNGVLELKKKLEWKWALIWWKKNNRNEQ